MPLAPGESFERYTIEELVGRGGMGEVYRATDTRLGRQVALKVLRSDDEAVASTTAAGGVQRLLREARASAAFNHPNTVAIYELGEAEGIPYIAMEYVRGRSLREFIGDASTPLTTKIEWLADTARALHAAHKAGLVHRDVKPGNIMISEDGIVKVLDFGLAKVLTQKIDPSGFQTQMGQVLGTPKYMAPEQLDGEPPTPKADQFAFGQVAYELLSGLYAGGPLAPKPKSLDKVVPGLPASIAQVVTRTLERRADARFASLDEVATALRAGLAGAAQLAGLQQVAMQKRASDAPTRAMPEVASRTVHRTEPIAAVSAQAVGAPSVPAPSRDGWNRTQPMRAPSIPMPAPAPISSTPVSSDRTPSSSNPNIASSGVYIQTPMSMSAPRPTYASTPLPQPAPGRPIALIAALVAVALVLGGALIYVLARR